MIALRPYQTAALTALDKAEANGIQRPLVVLPTGSGKTVVFAHMVASRPGRSIVLVHRDELIGQTVEKMSLIAPDLKVGVVKAERDEHDAQVVVASIQTAYQPQRMERLRGFDTVVVDEAHHASAPSWQKVLDHLGSFRDGGPFTCGFTATPERDQGKKLGHVWQTAAYYRSIREMIYEGYLVPITGQVVDTAADFSKVRVNRGDFSESDLGAELENSGAIDEIADAYLTYAKDRKGVAFTPTVATAQALAAALSVRGVSAEAVWGNMPTEERRAVLKRLRSGQTQCVTNCAILTEGFDEATVDCIVVARPTKAHALYIQMAGRGLRLCPGKNDCLILDITGVTERHDLVALVDLGLGYEGGTKPNEDAEEAPDSEFFCELCGRPLSVDFVEKRVKALVARGIEPTEERLAALRHSSCRAMRTSKVDVFATSKLRWLEVPGGHVLPSGKEVIVMSPAPSGDGCWTLASYAAGRIEVLHASLPVDWASGIGEDRAKAFGSLAKRDARWLAEAPTPAQLTRLVREGLPEARVGRVTTRGQAADLLTRIQGRRAIRKLEGMRK